MRIYISPPHLSGLELDYIHDAIRKNWITSQGDNVTGFEHDIATYLNHHSSSTSYALSLNSGTAAIHLALLLLDIGPGDVVLCQDLTFVATINAVKYVGAEPVLIGSEPDTWNLSPEYMEEAILDLRKKGKNPKATIWVNLYGMPAKIDEINAVAQKYGLFLIEDAAESLGARYKDSCCGTFGDVSAISFNGNKIITTSGGGMLTVRKPELLTRARYLAAQANEKLPWYEHKEVGYSYGMSNILAGIGRGQMQVLADRVAARRANFSFYQKTLSVIPGVTMHQEPNADFYSNYWLSVILVDPKKTGGKTRDDVRNRLAAAGIESRPVWKPMHLQPVYASCAYYGDQLSQTLFEQGLCLPSGSNLTQQELQEISDIITNTLVS